MKIKHFLIAIIAFCFIASLANADPWAHRYDGDGGQSWQTTGIQENTTLTVSVEWNQATWTSLDFGWGTSTDGTGWSWQDCPWFEDGGGSDKRCRTDVQFTSTLTNYYAFRLVYSGGTFYQYGDANWNDIAANTTLSADLSSYIVVVPEPTSIFLILLGLGFLKFRK